MNASKARIAKGGRAGVALVALIFGGRAWGAPPPPAPQSTLLGRATYSDPINVRRVGEDHWKVDVKAKPDLDVAVQTINFPAGSECGEENRRGVERPRLALVR